MIASPPQQRPLIVAHRGGSPDDVENSQPAFERALRIGVDLIECDLRTSADGSIILHHDERIGREAVSSLTVTELRERIPTLMTLDDLLMLVSGSGSAHRLVLDLKERGIERALIPVLEQRPDIVQSVLVSTVHTLSLKRLSHRFPGLRLALSRGHLVSSLPFRWLEWMAAAILRPVFPIWVTPQMRWCGAGTVALQHHLIDRVTVNRFRRGGLRMYAWTVDDVAELERLKECGVDYVATNEPWKLLGPLGRWPDEETGPI